MNSDVATVSGTGNIAAKKSGNTAIIVSNGDLQVSVTVIVNENGGAVEEKEEVQQGNLGQETEISEIVSVTDYPVLTSEILKYLYENTKKIIITSEDYTIYLNGDDIVNTDNELYTELVFLENENGFSFCVNNGQKLCGKIRIDLNPKVTNEKYLYLYNDEKEAYQELSVSDTKYLEIDTAGIYLLTTEKVRGLHVKKALVGGGCAMVFLAGGIYIVGIRRYWFW